MKILHTVENYSPSGGGMFEVVRQLSERLANSGHSVFIATKWTNDQAQDIINNVTVIRFKIEGNAVRGYKATKGELKRYQEFLLNTDFDIIANFAAQQWATDLMLPLLQKINAKKVFIPTGFSALFLPPYKSYFDKMKTWMRQYEANVFLSSDYRDINFAKEHSITNCHLIPNGASETEFAACNDNDIRSLLNIASNDFLILHVGSHTCYKGHREAIRIFQLAKIKSAVLLIVGSRLDEKCYRDCIKAARNFNSPSLKNSLINKIKIFFLGKTGNEEKSVEGKKILIRELSRTDTVKAYQTADLFLFPSNIECSPIVLFECAASKTPFLASDAGNSREIAAWTGGGIILPTVFKKNGYCTVNIEESAKILEAIYSDPQKRESMKNNAYNNWKDKYTWEKIAADYEKMYSDLLES